MPQYKKRCQCSDELMHTDYMQERTIGFILKSPYKLTEGYGKAYTPVQQVTGHPLPGDGAFEGHSSPIVIYWRRQSLK